jgi:hypothetical protein
MTHRFAVMLVVETDDRALSEDAIVTALRTAAGTARMRHNVLKSLPGSVQRLVAVFPEDHAQMLMMVHTAIGEDLTGEEQYERPPPDYVPPTRD